MESPNSHYLKCLEQLKGTFTDKSQLGPEHSEVSPDLDKFIKRYIKESLKNKY